MDEQETLWTKNFIALATVNGLIYFIFYLLMMVVATYAMEVLKTSPSQAGLAAGVFMLAALIGRLFTGRYIEQIGKKKLVYYGTFFYLGLLPCYFLVAEPLFFILVRFLHGLGMGVATSALATLSVYIIPAKRRGEGLGYYSLSTTLAMAMGPMFGMHIYSRWGFTANLCFCMFLAVLIAGFTLTMKVPDFTADKAALQNFGTGFSSLFEKSALPISCIGTVCFFCYSGLSSFLGSYVKSVNLVEAGNIFFLAYSIILFVSRPAMGKFYDRRGNKVMYVALIPFILGFGLVAMAHNSLVLILGAICLGFGFGNFTTIGRAISLQNLPPTKFGLASSTFLAISEVGSGFGPFLLGIVLPLLGYRNMYLTLAGIAAMSLILFYFWYGRKSEI